MDKQRLLELAGVPQKEEEQLDEFMDLAKDKPRIYYDMKTVLSLMQMAVKQIDENKPEIAKEELRKAIKLAIARVTDKKIK